MMKLRTRQSKRSLTITEKRRIGSGGEATVYVAPEQPGCAVKVFHADRDLRTLEAKLSRMLLHPPDNPTQSSNHASIAWPVDLVEDSTGQFRGYLMPFVSTAANISEYLNPKARRTVDPTADYRMLMHVARNLAATMAAIHERGYVVGDVNEQNVLVSPNALVTLIDTDSFQVPGANGSHFLCTVGKGLYLPAELHGQSLSAVVRSRQQDVFGLAVLIYQLLMEGTHPYSGIDRGENSLTIEDRIRAGLLPYRDSEVVAPPPIAPPVSILPPGVQQLFHRAFARPSAATNPSDRPEAREWSKLLWESANALIPCDTSPSRHFFGKQLPQCPWCQRRDLFGGFDTFGGADQTTSPAKTRSPRVVWDSEHPTPQTVPVASDPEQPAESLAAPCPLCASSCKSAKTLAKHLRKSHPTIAIPIRCRFCPKPKEFREAKSLADHLESKHALDADVSEIIRQLMPPQSHVCPKCSKTFKTKEAQAQHHKSAHETPPPSPPKPSPPKPASEMSTRPTVATQDSWFEKVMKWGFGFFFCWIIPAVIGAWGFGGPGYVGGSLLGIGAGICFLISEAKESNRYGWHREVIGVLMGMFAIPGMFISALGTLATLLIEQATLTDTTYGIIALVVSSVFGFVSYRLVDQ